METEVVQKKKSRFKRFMKKTGLKMAFLASLFLAGSYVEYKYEYLPWENRDVWVAEDPDLITCEKLIEKCEPRLDPKIRKYYAINIVKYCFEYEVPMALEIAVLNNEGHWNPLAISKTKAQGLGQIMEKFHKERIEQYGASADKICYVDVNIRASCEYLSTLLKKFDNNPKLAAAAYNCGPNRDSLKNGQVPKIKETKDYYRWVLDDYAMLVMYDITKLAMR